MKRRKIYSAILVMTTFTLMFSGCKKQEGAKVEAEMPKSEVETEEVVEEDNGLSEEAQAIVDAIQNTLDLPAFEMKSDILMNLNGKKVNMTGELHSETEIVQGKKPEDLQMLMETTSNLGKGTAFAYYKDGIYYTDDENGKNKVEKSPEEALQTVTDITAMVTEAAGEITDVTVTQDGDNAVYSYNVPAYIAESYLEEVIESKMAEGTPISGAKVNVDSLQMVSTVDASGCLAKQEIVMQGEVKKSIIKVPADANVTATFKKSKNTSVAVPAW